MPTKGIAGVTVLPTGVLQQLAYHRNRPFGVSRSPTIRCCPCVKRERGRRKLDDVAAALRIEQIGATELVGKGLAIVAIADDAIDRPSATRP